MSIDADSRSQRLSSYFNLVLSGKRQITTSTEAKRFLEAICQHANCVECVEKLLASPPAQQAMKMAVRMDITPAFINQSTAYFIIYLSDPLVKQLCNSQFLQRLLSIIAYPPTLVNGFAGYIGQDVLSELSVKAFAWLLHELLVLSNPSESDASLEEVARTMTTQKDFLNHSSHDVRVLGHKIQKVLLLRTTNVPQSDSFTPGGRHDNDHSDFRKISILPTGDELLSKERAFYRHADDFLDADPEERPAIYLDNQFRLLREDMLCELRLDLQVATGKTNVKRQVVKLQDLEFAGVRLGEPRKRKPSAFRFACTSGIPRLSHRTTVKERKTYLNENKSYLKHQSYGCLLRGREIMAFATLERDVDLLAADWPEVTLIVTDAKLCNKVMVASLSGHKLEFVMVDTPIFAYRPILEALQSKTDFPMAEQLLSFRASQNILSPNTTISDVVDRLRARQGQGLHEILDLPKSIDLDPSQTRALLAGLQQILTLILGPPGTGKSFIGALLAKVFHDCTNFRILVLAYTNHALDQFMEDLMDIGIPESSMVRLGSKSSSRTGKLSLFNQMPPRQSPQTSFIYERSTDELEDLSSEIIDNLNGLDTFRVSESHVLQYLEFSETDSQFFDAFSVTLPADGMKIADRGGKKIRPDYLLRRWRCGQNAGVFQDISQSSHHDIWAMDTLARQKLYQKWQLAVLEEKTESITLMMDRYDKMQCRHQGIRNMGRNEILKQKRIIGCTTTGAAMHTPGLLSAAPDIVIVEEAGEILESHVLTAMTGQTRQIILIGDHKQLRPKINNYELTVAKGSGYNLDQSLFERLVLKGFIHQTLNKQHRMPPEVSAIVRHLTYPELEDSTKTLNRPALRGLQDRVIFVDHEHPEQLQENILADRRDQGATTSKRNIFEAEMILKCVKYLGQQGYGTDKLVILTPYLGQLSLLRQQLSAENDPVLNDLDYFDLVRAGLMTRASAAHSRRTIRLSTIDNYQGEESDVVVVSLTRSNAEGDVGFMSSPQRLNVLLSRARIGMILIGNSATFKKSKKGREIWVPFFDFISGQGHLYDGLPVKCERHPDKIVLLRQKEDFDLYCPDGGCSEPCGTVLNCGMHKCPQRCHQLYDHSKMECQTIVQQNCVKGHLSTMKCFQQRTSVCTKCKRDEQLDQEQQRRQMMYAQRMAELKADIAHKNRILKDRREEKEREDTINQIEKDLSNVNMRALNTAKAGVKNQTKAAVIGDQDTDDSTQKSNANRFPKPNSTPLPKQHVQILSDAKDDWESRKRCGEENEVLDELMEMIGLENVKEQFLCIKDKIDLAIRQDIDLKNERFSASLLGNPGTGKTTVARLYAKFLASVGALPGSFVQETTGSSLASDGVSGCKKVLEEILNKGGGAFFIDEAYQLASGVHPGGKQVLDFLLAEVENLRGKVVFILAGYNKQMEDFFAHNPGLPSRFPREMQFKDYEDNELLCIMKYQIDKRYEGRLKIDDDISGLFARIVSRRIGRGRGREGFGNARAVENTLEKVFSRQAKRIRQERRAGKTPDDMLLTKEDLIGPEPSGILSENKSWKTLQELTGLASVKDSLMAVFHSIEHNYHRELTEKPLVEFNLNRVFVGSPGTGKTTVAKLYGQILVDLGLLSSGEVVIKTPADFVGSALGESEKNTKGILAATVGKVLVIDEAYGLCGTASGNQPDPFKTAIIDTIVAEVQSTPGDDRCVLLLGYQDQMEAMMQSVNPGLSRRFPLDSAFNFEDFTDEELRLILDLKLNKQAMEVTDQAKRVAMDVLKRARNRPNFGNAGEVDIILNEAKVRQQKRISASGRNSYALQAVDFDPDFDRSKKGATKLRKLFEDVVGSESIISQLEGYQKTVENMAARGMDPREQIPFNFLFRGPPGTGKTTTARKMGKVYYDMGFLSKATVEECSATELVGEYVGQTGPKTQKLLEKGLGKVLFIDEAYRLADGQFAKEAMDELVDCLTKDKFAGKMVTILAGYDEHINRLMSMNPGLTSRFPESVQFDPLTPEACLALLRQLLQKRKSALDCTVLEHPTENFRNTLLDKFASLSNVANWANARDVQTISKNIFHKVMSTADPSPSAIPVDEKLILTQLDKMLSERRHRDGSIGSWRPLLHSAQGPVQRQDTSPNVAHTRRIRTDSKVAEAPPKLEDPEAPPRPEDPEAQAVVVPSTQDEEPRDAGVDGQTWLQLQQDKKTADDKERDYHRLLQEEEAVHNTLAEVQKQEACRKETTENELNAISDQAESAAADEARRRFEQERIEHELQRRAREEELAELERRRKAAEEERKREALAQQKLKAMGVCVAGFRWIKQAAGYRCAGGSHFVSNEQLN